MSEYDDLINIMRREAEAVHFHDQQKSTLVCTSYDPDQHAIKGMIVPSMVESDWIPIGVAHAGAGFGMLVGPKVGSADGLDGDQFHIQFENGDPDSPMAVHKHFSTVDNPPQVQSGEMLLQHESGAKVFFDQNSNLTVGGSQTNQQVFLAQDGSVTATDSSQGQVQIKGGNVLHQDSAGGQVYISGGKVHLGSQSASVPVMTESGPSSTVFAMV